MTGTPFFSVEPSTLAALATRLDGIGDQVGSSALFTAAHGAEAYGDLTEAVGDFHDDWTNAVARIQEQVRGWGQQTTALGKMMADHDAALGQALSPDGGG